MGERRQKGKGGKRLRKWHHGRAQGRKDERVMKGAINPAFARAEADMRKVEERTVEHRASARDHDEAVGQLARVSPYVPSWELDGWF